MKQVIKLRAMKNTEWQADFERPPTFLSSEDSQYLVSLTAYFSQLEIFSHRKAFPVPDVKHSLLWFMDRRYEKAPRADNLCSLPSATTPAEQLLYYMLQRLQLPAYSMSPAVIYDIRTKVTNSV